MGILCEVESRFNGSGLGSCVRQERADSTEVGGGPDGRYSYVNSEASFVGIIGR